MLARPSSIALPFAALFALLALATSGLAVWLVGRTVEERIHDQLRDTARLVSGGTIPLSDQTVSLVASYIHAEVVVVAGRRVQATSLDPARARAFVAALDGPTLAVSQELVISPATIGGAEQLVARAPLPASPGRALYLLYPRELESEERRRASRPVLFVSLVGVALATLLGTIKERSVVRERTRALERLVSALAHEVKNPLGAIGLTVETVREALPGPREKEAADVIASEVERLGLLVDQLRVLSGSARFVPRPTSPGDVLASVVALLRRTVEHRGLVLDAPPADDPALARAVLVDPRALKQVLLNLVLNAIEASPRGGKVRVRAPRPGRLEVSDDGPGVAPEVRATLFEPFVTTKEGGTGLGLALSRRVAEAHGGSLVLVDSMGGAPGATFALELPLAPGPGARS